MVLLPIVTSNRGEMAAKLIAEATGTAVNDEAHVAIKASRGQLDEVVAGAQGVKLTHGERGHDFRVFAAKAVVDIGEELHPEFTHESGHRLRPCADFAGATVRNRGFQSGTEFR